MNDYQSGLNPNFLDPKESHSDIESNIFNGNANNNLDIKASNQDNGSENVTVCDKSPALIQNRKMKNSKYSLFQDNNIKSPDENDDDKENKDKNAESKVKMTPRENKVLKSVDNLEYEIEIFDHFCRKKHIKLSGLKRKLTRYANLDIIINCIIMFGNILIMLIYGRRPFAVFASILSFSMIFISLVSKKVFYRHSYKEFGVRCDLRTLLWIVLRTLTHVLYFILSFITLIMIIIGTSLEQQYSNLSMGFLTIFFWIGEIIYMTLIFKATFSIVYCIKLRNAYLIYGTDTDYINPDDAGKSKLKKSPVKARPKSMEKYSDNIENISGEIEK